MRGHRTLTKESEHGHKHTNTEVLYTVCRRLLDELEPRTTVEGLLDARECMENGIRLAAEKGVEPAQLLLMKLHDMLEEAKRPL